jgi:threonine/homoserine/homoserine lactone efflux protein
MSWTYLLTAAAMILVPGPDVLLVTGRALTGGVRPALRVVAGTASGYLIVTTAVAVGVGAAVAAVPVALDLLRWAAVGYLLLLARQAWRHRPGGLAAVATATRPWRDVRDGLLTAALNPKGLVFFLALLPPFVDPARPAVPQLLALGGAFCALTVLLYGGVALLAARLGRRGTSRGSRLPAFALVGAALVVAFGPA